MSFLSCYHENPTILMEGALGERLKREYNLPFDNTLGIADIIYRNGGEKALLSLWQQYALIASDYHLPFIATTPTRRANIENVSKSAYNKKIIEDNVEFLCQLKNSSNSEIYIGGLMGCKGDAYKATEILQPQEAKTFHSWQAGIFAESKVDFLYAGIMPALSEAIGMAMAMEETGLPYIISFMIRDNGCLIDGTTIDEAIKTIDGCTLRTPLCYMTNCVHPTILYHALKKEFNQTSLVSERFHGIQANASALSPEELDHSEILKCSNCDELAQAMVNLKELISLKIVGGCCGTDSSHMNQIAKMFSYAK